MTIFLRSLIFRNFDFLEIFFTFFYFSIKIIFVANKITFYVKLNLIFINFVTKYNKKNCLIAQRAILNSPLNKFEYFHFSIKKSNRQ